MDYRPYSRPSWDEYFMKMAYLAAERSTCLRHHVGAVMVRDNHIISTGYNGAAKGIKDCIRLGCLRDQMGIISGTRHEICRAIHAEQNAIIQAASHSADTKGTVVYCTHSPCIICAKMLVNAGVKRFVTSNEYPDPLYKELFAEAGVGFEVIPRPDMKIQVLD
ncbi:MAG: deoxycytidylate deaminase [Candidatus Goldiibacteriota bacterium]